MHETLQDNKIGGNVEIQHFDFWAILWHSQMAILGSAREEIFIIQSGDKTRRLGPDKIAGVDKNLPDVLLGNGQVYYYKFPSPQVA